MFQMVFKRLPLFEVVLASQLVYPLACGSPPGSGPDRQSDERLADIPTPQAGPQDVVEHNETSRRKQLVSAESDALHSLTGTRTRVVWVQDVADGTDILSAGDQLILKGYDTHDGLGERAILDTVANYAKPLITPLGHRVVFSDHRKTSTFVVNWDGSELRELGRGFALATWIDSKTGIEWVYMGNGEASTQAPSYQRITRHQLDRWSVSEVVWDKRPVNNNSFQVSADGRLAGGLFPWPRAGLVELPNGAWHRIGTGCWTGFSGHSASLFWYFDGSHRNLTLVDVERDERWQVNINDAPGIDGYEVYHPRWTNHPLFLVMTGPYSMGDSTNRIRGGGHQVEIYIGRFASNLASVEKWVQVTFNQHADFYPDAWIDPSKKIQEGVVVGIKRDSGSLATEVMPRHRLVVEARVLVSAPIPTPESILPYRQALLVNEYEVLQVLSGTYVEKKVLVAHWVIKDGKVLAEAQRQAGTVVQMTLDMYDEHEELEGERLIMDSDAFNLRLYYELDN